MNNIKNFKNDRQATPDLSDAEMLAICTAKSADWEEVLTQWLLSSNWVHRRCYVLLGNRADAEDAAQEVILKVIRAIDQFESRASLRTWVTRITDNHCYTLIKRRSAQAIGDHLQFSIALIEANRMREEVSDYEDAERVVAVHSTLERLTANNRTVLELRFFRELSLEQMATTLNLSLSATKMRLYRAMDAFKKKHPTDALYGM